MLAAQCEQAAGGDLKQAHSMHASFRVLTPLRTDHFNNPYKQNSSLAVCRAQTRLDLRT